MTKYPIPTTDIIIEHSNGKKDGIVLITRKNFPFGIALPGGLAEYGLSLEENAVKEAREETGLEVELRDPERPLCVHSDPERDPRYHLISVTYVGQGTGELQAGDDAATATLYSIDDVVDLLEDEEKWAFPDHRTAIRKYLGNRVFGQ